MFTLLAEMLSHLTARFNAHYATISKTNLHHPIPWTVKVPILAVHKYAVYMLFY